MDYSATTLSIATLPAKSSPYQSVQTHSLVTGIIGQELCSAYLTSDTRDKLARALSLDPDSLLQFIGYLSSLHDIGKMAPQFMHRIAAHCDASLSVALAEAGMAPVVPTSKRIAHESTSYEIVKALWTGRPYSVRTRNLLAHVLGAHHQKMSEGEVPERPDTEPWKTLHSELESEMSIFFGWGKERGIQDVSTADTGFVGAILNGLVILADWIASGEFFEDAESMVALNGAEWVRDRVHQFFKLSELVQEESLIWGESFDEVWPQFKGKARPLQRELEMLLQVDSDPALLLIEAPMGEGKTEAALYAAARAARNGFYVALPTGATANQMAMRVTEFLSGHETEQEHPSRVRLLHSMAWLSDSTGKTLRSPDDEMNAAVRWLDPVRRGLLAPYAVGTVDQAMMAGMYIKYGVLRLLGLAGKTLIIDEVHAYDVYMGAIIEGLLSWCRAIGTPVVLLSATLPPEKKAALLAPYVDGQVTARVDSYPSITAVSWQGDVTVREVEPATDDKVVQLTTLPILRQPEQIAEYAAQLVSDGGCACVLLNTVGQAQDVYRALEGIADDDCTLQLFHSRFPAQRRANIERECVTAFGKDKRKRPHKAILVATQVVEQSLDIDVDVLMTSVAPMDLILQRAGRMHRHAETVRPDGLQKPQLYLLFPPDDNWDGDGAVYPECLLRHSTDIVQSLDAVHIPSDIPALVERGYSSDGLSAEELENWTDHLFEDQFLYARGEHYRLKDPSAGFQPLKRCPPLDDLENEGYLSAKTRLGSPSVRIALLESELYAEASAVFGETSEETLCSQRLARMVMERSVSIPETKMQGYDGGLRGRGRLAGVCMYPSVDNVYTTSDGRRIVYDEQLGVLLDDAKK